MMKVITGAIGSGKTYNLLKDCNEKKGVVVVFDNYQRRFYEQIIKEWKFNDVKEIITYDSFLKISWKERRDINFFFELDFLFDGVGKDSTVIITSEELSVVKRVIKEDGSSDFTRENISLE